MKIKSDYSNEPQWREVNIKSSLPKELTCLDEIAHNLWYGWTHEARSLFTHLDEELYEKVGHNPVLLLEQLSYDRKEAIVKDKELMKRVKNVYILRRDMLSLARPNMKILHPLPRVNEIAYDVDDCSHAYYIQQARNGLFAREAIFCHCLGISLEEIKADKTII